MVGTFCALDLVLFYLFSGRPDPVFLIIGVWVGRAGLCLLQVLLYTLLGSV